MGSMTIGQTSASVAVIATVSLFACSSVIAKPLPPKEGCRAVSRLEYNTAKKENVITSKGGRYVRTGPFWRRYYWHCPV
jgi:hypothetical protein